MSKYTFHIEWTTELEIDAPSEEEAWDSVHDSVVDAFGKSKGDLRIDIAGDKSTHGEWDDFDTDPEQEDITNLAVDNDYYL